MSGKKAQRTKGNLQPSSSSRAAKFLQNEGQTTGGFIGFGGFSALGATTATTQVRYSNILDPRREKVYIDHIMV